MCVSSMRLSLLIKTVCTVKRYKPLLCIYAGSGDQLVEGEGGKLFLGATVCIGDMQRLRETPDKKNPTSKFKINGQSFELHAFYNALQANGGAVDAVRHAARWSSLVMPME